MEKLAEEIVEAMELPMIEEVMAIDEPSHGDSIIVEEPKHEAKGKEEDEKYDPETGKGLKHFLKYINDIVNKIPQHSGKTTAGCERAISYLNDCDRQISKAVKEDMSCDIDDMEVEKVRKNIRGMVKKLKKRHNEINDAYDAEDGAFAADTSDKLVKEADGSWTCPECSKVVAPGDAEHKARHNAMEHGHEADDKEDKKAAVEDSHCPKCKIQLWKAAEGLFECLGCDEVFEKVITKEAGTPHLTLVMTPFERAVTGAIINSFVSQGKNPEETYAEFKKKYAFTDRDELSIQQILMDMGYPMLKDRGHIGDKEGDQLKAGKGIEFATQYNA